MPRARILAVRSGVARGTLVREMSSLLELLVVLVTFAMPVLIVVGVVRMMRAGGRGRGVGIGNVMTDLDAILQPHHPTAEVLEQAKEGEEEHDDDGDDEDPELGPGNGRSPPRKPSPPVEPEPRGPV